MHVLEMPNRAGVYALEHIANGKVYVGSSINVARRVAHHRYLLERHRHHNPYLQRAYDQHGALRPVILELLPHGQDRAALLAIEQRWIDGLSATSPAHGYNIHTTASSSEAIVSAPERLSVALHERKRGTLTELGRMELAIALKQRWAREGERAVFSETMRERWASDAHRLKMQGAYQLRREQPDKLALMRNRLEEARRSPRREQALRAYWALRKNYVAKEAGLATACDLDEAVSQAYRDGKSARAIAAILGVSHNRVVNWLRANNVVVRVRGVGRRQPQMSENALRRAGHDDMASFDANVAVLYAAGFSVNALRLEMRLSSCAIRTSLSRSGVSLRKHKAALDLWQRERVAHVDHVSLL